jgi:hypothetical protein
MRSRATMVLLVAGLASGAAHAGAVTPTSSQAEKLVQLAKHGRPTDLNKYSLRFWPRNSLTRGQVVTTNTPYGKLTCRSTGSDLPRTCSLSRR